jgi:hypothetical protein
MNNIKLNNLITEEKQNELLNDLISIESRIEDSNNTILLKLLNELDEKYLNWTQNNVETVESTENEMEKLMIIELKDELYNKVIKLLNTNPEWEEYLNPIIEKLTYTNITLEYLQDKLDTIKELEDETEVSYKDQLNNLCLFVKNQLDEGLIELEKDKIVELTNLVNENILLLDKNIEIDWENKLKEFNVKCEIICLQN